MLNNCEAKGQGCVLTLPIYRGREQHGNGQEAGDKGTGSGRVRYGRREVLTPLSPPPPPHRQWRKMWKVLNRVLKLSESVLAFALKREQELSMHHLFNCIDVMSVLPTGFEKSLIFQMFVMMCGVRNKRN